jgi:hypothetical protein
MLTAKENKMLTEVGKGKPMGEFMRRYWIPAAKSELGSAQEAPTEGSRATDRSVLECARRWKYRRDATTRRRRASVGLERPTRRMGWPAKSSSPGRR